VLVAFVDKYMPSLGLNVDTFEHLLRKVAHVFVYLVLGLLVSHAFYRTGFKNKTNIMNTAVFCLFYAATDELHQLLVPGRGPSVADIVIDWGGTYLGIFLFWFILLVHAHFAGRKAWDDLVGD
jgi:VanZ family protein